MALNIDKDSYIETSEREYGELSHSFTMLDSVRKQLLREIEEKNKVIEHHIWRRDFVKAERDALQDKVKALEAECSDYRNERDAILSAARELSKYIGVTDLPKEIKPYNEYIKKQRMSWNDEPLIQKED